MARFCRFENGQMVVINGFEKARRPPPGVPPTKDDLDFVRHWMNRAAQAEERDEDYPNLYAAFAKENGSMTPEDIGRLDRAKAQIRKEAMKSFAQCLLNEAEQEE